MHWGALLGDVRYTSGGVPKILHQIWINERPELPEAWSAARAEWKAHHPEWKHMIWCKSHARAYIAESHPRYLGVFDGLPHAIQRIDMIRYFFLYDFGGVYCDLDQYPTQNIEPYLETGAQAYFVHSANWSSFTNCLMASKRGAPIWLEVQARLRVRPPWWCIGKHLTVMMTTGPCMLDSVLRNTAEQYAVLPRRRFNAYAEHEIQAAQTGPSGPKRAQAEAQAGVPEVQDPKMVHKKPGAIIVSLLGKTWNGFDSALLNFAARNKGALAATVLALVVCLAAAATIFAVRWRRLRRAPCASVVAHCARGNATLAGLS